MKRKYTALTLIAAAALLTGCAEQSSQELVVITPTDTTTTEATTTAPVTTTTTAADTTTNTTETTTTTTEVTTTTTAGESPDHNERVEAEQAIYWEGFKDGYEKGVNSGANSAVWISGDFTATIHKIMPDFVSDPTTNRVAIITFFQDDPILVYIDPEILNLLVEEETYTFELAGQDITIPATKWFAEDGSISSDALSGVRLKLTNVRLPEEDELGLDSNRIKASAFAVATDEENN